MRSRHTVLRREQAEKAEAGRHWIEYLGTRTQEHWPGSVSQPTWRIELRINHWRATGSKRERSDILSTEKPDGGGCRAVGNIIRCWRSWESRSSWSSSLAPVVLFTRLRQQSSKRLRRGLADGLAWPVTRLWRRKRSRQWRGPGFPQTAYAAGSQVQAAEYLLVIF